MKKQQLIVATGNAHKAEEFDSLLAGAGFDVVSAQSCGGMPDVVEDGDSFAANARIKARALRSIAPDSAWILSDDSGLEVDALDGAPGIYSARFAGESASDQDNVRKLLAELEGQRTDLLDRHTVGKDSYRFKLNALTSSQRTGHGIAVYRLHADDLDLRAQRLDIEGHPGQQSTTAHRNENRIESPGALP